MHVTNKNMSNFLMGWPIWPYTVDGHLRQAHNSPKSHKCSVEVQRFKDRHITYPSLINVQNVSRCLRLAHNSPKSQIYSAGQEN